MGSERGLFSSALPYGKNRVLCKTRSPVVVVVVVVNDRETDHCT